MTSEIKKLRNTKYFPVIKELTNSKFYPILRQVYPLKQIYVQRLLEYLPAEPEIKKIILFGSSITMRCRADSDIDVMVWLSDGCDEIKRGKLSGVICGLLGDNADVLMSVYFPPTESIWNDIRKGVLLYEQAV